MPKLHRIAILSAVLAVCSFLVGVWGFGILEPNAPYLNNVYQALRLFPLEGPIQIHSLPWQLETARFVAPFSLLLGIVATIFHVSRDLLNSFLLKLLRGHVVIAGLNEISADFAIDAIATGHKVVVIGNDPDSPWLYDLKARGAVHLMGDFTDTHSLERARVWRASRFFAFSEDDAQNVEAVMTLSDLLKQATHRATKLDKPLRCYTLHQDPTFHQAFREHSLLNTTPDAMDVSLVNLDALAARITLEQMPMEEDPSGNICENPHLVIFGYSPISMALLRQALHLGHYLNRKKLPVSLVTSEPDHLRLQLNQYFRQAEHIARIEIITAEDDTPASYLQALETSNPSPESWYTLVCASVHDKQNFTMAQHLSNHAHALPGRIHCSLPNNPGLISLLRSRSSGRHIHSLPRPADLATWQSIVNEPHETLARTIHNNYVALELASGKNSADNSSLVPWGTLPEAMREQNRLQADHLQVKLRAIGMRLDSLPDKEKLKSALIENLELLAEIEHLRWNAVQFMAGWKYAPGKKNPDHLTHPCLVSWDELTDEIKQYDRDAVMNIPNIIYPSKDKLT
jgi:hypothetical protein